jgi:hypothetical protein
MKTSTLSPLFLLSMACAAPAPESQNPWTPPTESGAAPLSDTLTETHWGSHVVHVSKTRVPVWTGDDAFGCEKSTFVPTVFLRVPALARLATAANVEAKLSLWFLNASRPGCGPSSEAGTLLSALETVKEVDLTVTSSVSFASTTDTDVLSTQERCEVWLTQEASAWIGGTWNLKWSSEKQIGTRVLTDCVEESLPSASEWEAPFVSWSASEPQTGMQEKSWQVHESTTVLPVVISSETVVCSQQGYTLPLLKIFIPQLAWLTTFDHRNARDGRPCIAAGECSDTLGTNDLLGAGAGVDHVPVRVQWRSDAIIDHDRQRCEARLVENVTSTIRGVEFTHHRFGSFEPRRFEDCVQ